MGVQVVERNRQQAADQQSQPESGPDDRAVKVSVSMPGSTIAEVRSRVGKNQFSRYVTQAVERQLRLDMLGEVVDAYVAEHGPLDEELVRKAEAEWHDAFGE